MTGEGRDGSRSRASLLLQGLWITLKLAVSTVLVGLVLGMLLAMAKLSKNGWLRRPAYAFTNFMRGIPEFLVLLVIYFGGTQVLSAITPGGAIEISPFAAGLTALSLIFGAYASETFRAAFQSVPKGQSEAGRAWRLQRVEDLPLHPVAADLAGGDPRAGQPVARLGRRHRSRSSARRPDAEVEPGRGSPPASPSPSISPHR